MAESSWPTVAGSRVVTDDQWEQLASAFSDDGIVDAPGASTAVYGDGSGRQVKIRANKLAVVGGHGYFSGTSDVVKTITANVSGLTRIDRVVLGLDRTTWAVTSYVKAGTPGSGTAPALQRDAKGVGTGKWEISLATVTVVNGASLISASDVVVDQPYIRLGWNTSWGVVARHRRTTSSAFTSGETGVIRLNTAVVGGRLYRVSTNDIVLLGSNANDTIMARFRYDTGSSPSASVASPVLGGASVIAPTYTPEITAAIAYYPATVSTVLSVLLCVGKQGGVGTGQIIVDATYPSIEVFIEDLGPDPGSSGTNI